VAGGFQPAMRQLTMIVFDSLAGFESPANHCTNRNTTRHDLSRRYVVAYDDANERLMSLHETSRDSL